MKERATKVNRYKDVAKTRADFEEDQNKSASPDWDMPSRLAGLPLTPQNALTLQRTIGNRAVTKLVQAKRASLSNSNFIPVQRQEEGDEDVTDDEEQTLQAKRAIQRDSNISSSVQRQEGEDEEADVEADDEEQMLQAKRVIQRDTQHEQVTKHTTHVPVVQRVGPAAGAAIGAAEWIGLGAAGYVVAQDAVSGTAGDISYTFDEMEGVLLPGGGNDVEGYRKAHPDANIRSHTFVVTAWQGSAGSKKMGVQFAVTFNYDGHAIGNISCRVLDTYDWPMWEGSINVNFTPLSLATGDVSTIRITINGNADRTFAGGRARSRILLLTADGVIRVTGSGLYARVRNE